MSIQAQSPDPLLQGLGITRPYRRRSEIIREDDAANRVYEVISGTVCTCKMLRDGRRQIAGFYFSGDLFGLEAARTHALSAQAITDAEVRTIKKQALNALASAHGDFADRLLALTARDLARKQDLMLFLSRSAQDRIIYFLVEMARRTSPKEDSISLPMSRQDIGDYLGLKIETVSRVFWDLERRGAIEVAGRHTIVLRNDPTNLSAKRLMAIFEAVKGRQPQTEQELETWRASAEGKAATLFDLTTISIWGERARS